MKTPKEEKPVVAEVVPGVPVEETKGKKAKAPKEQKVGGLHPLNYVIVLMLLAGATLVGFATSGVLKAVTPNASANAVPTLPPIPKLNLNKNHARQGPTVTVDQGAIGRDNPFLKP